MRVIFGPNESPTKKVPLKKKRIFDIEQEYCCGFIRDIVHKLDFPDGYSYKIPIHYSAKMRYFILADCPPTLHKGGHIVKQNHVLTGFRLTYCPCCGAKFPEDLINKWYTTLKKEYNLSDPESDEEITKIPSDFFCAQWWKKRKL
jgi:hypothetical protein